MHLDITPTIQHIRAQYAKREMNGVHEIYAAYPIYQNAIIAERQKHYTKILSDFSQDFASVKLMEIGAGYGQNLSHFADLGLQWDNIFANELLPERVSVLRKNLPTQNIFEGNAIDLPFANEFDVVFQSTVFSSILSESFRQALANKMWKMLKENGIILWYDFIYNNPKNCDVRKVDRGHILKYFPQAKQIDFYSTTMAPPIGRRISNAYTWMNALFPFLRSHLIAVIYK